LELKEEEVAPLGLSFLTSPMLFFLGHASPPRVRTDRRQVFLKHNQTHYRFPLIPGPDRDRARWRPAQAGVGSQDLRSAHDHECTRGLATRYRARWRPVRRRVMGSWQTGDASSCAFICLHLVFWMLPSQ
jgi:hypothetical protein